MEKFEGLNSLPPVEDDNEKEDSLEKQGLSIGDNEPEKEEVESSETNKEHLTDYPDNLKERIDERSKENGGAETLNDLSEFSRDIANSIEADRNSINNFENEGNEKIMLAHSIREAINTEIGLIKKSPEERLKGINLLIERVSRHISKELSIELLNSDLSQEEKSNIENNIVRHESMISFLNDRKEGIERNLK
jgi:DNA-binding XRE family transcriptional regulator